MLLSFSRSPEQRRGRILRAVTRALSPHYLRDIGIQPWPDRPRLPLCHFC